MQFCAAGSAREGTRASCGRRLGDICTRQIESESEDGNYRGVEEQKEALKGTLEEEVVALNVSIDKFGNRWRQLKPTDSKSWEYSEIQKIFLSLEVNLSINGNNIFLVYRNKIVF